MPTESIHIDRTDIKGNFPDLQVHHEQGLRYHVAGAGKDIQDVRKVVSSRAGLCPFDIVEFPSMRLYRVCTDVSSLVILAQQLRGVRLLMI